MPFKSSFGRPAFAAMGILASLLAGCGGGSSAPSPAETVFTLTVNSTNPATGVAISVSPADTNALSTGSTTFTRTYNSGQSVILTAPATVGANTFSSWNGCTSTTGTSCTITMSANEAVTANYTTPAAVTYTLTVDSTDPASGVAIGVSPADNGGNSVGTTGFTRTYNSGTTVTLTAPATSGANTFSAWTGCTSTTGPVCTVTLNADTTVTAAYMLPVPVAYTLTVNSTSPASGVAVGVSPADTNGNSAGTTSFTRTYNSGTMVTLTAPATSGTNPFASWTGCTSTTEPVCTVLISADTTVTANYTPPAAYTLTVNSATPASGVAIQVTPADSNSNSSGTTSFTRTYASGSNVTLTAPASVGAANFSSWSGCTSASTVTCQVANLSANSTVTANYTGAGVTSISVSPNPASVVIGETLQFSVSVKGNGSFGTGVMWSVSGPAGYTGSVGSISATGLYTTPYPPPASVTVTATSTSTSTVSGSTVLTFASPATSAGPPLTVDPGMPTHAISPEIYGMNDYALDSTTVKNANPAIIRWGGDNTSRYNYVANTTNSASDYYFESFSGAGGQWPTGNFNDLVTSAASANAEVVGNAPVIGWITTSNTSSSACSFQKSTYPDQQSYNGVCGNGTNTDGTTLVGNNTIAGITSMSEPPPAPPAAGDPVASSWVGNWVTSIVSQFGPGNPSAGTGKGVAHWDLDNEPEYWSAVHRDVHPIPMTYDEVTNGGIGTALAIKTADPTALVSGPVISNWYNFFYSTKDVDGGYSTGPCYKPWSNPGDRQAHAGIPFIEYYLQQMQAAETTYGKRLLDFVDVHTYFAADYNDNSTGLTAAGDTPEQVIRLNSTRVFWDPTYTDPNYTQPNYPTDANYTANCNPPALAPQLIPTLQTWAARDYPGTRTSIDEYNFGGMESINGAVTQADILGIFGKYGLDKGILWPTTNYSDQVPGTMAFEIYRNYDGADSGFGDMAVSSTTADHGKLSVYGATRTSDGALTIVIINKTYGALTSTLALPNVNSGTSVQVYLYSSANLAGIVAQPAQTLTPPVTGASAATLTSTYPAQSITLLVVPAT